MPRIFLLLMVPVALLLTTGCYQDYEDTAKPVAMPSPDPSDGKTGVDAKKKDTTEEKLGEKKQPGNETDAKKLDAENVLKKAVADAKEQDKVVFVHLGAPW